MHCFGPLNRTNESVAALRERLDEPRLLRGVPQSFAHSFNSVVEAMLKIDERIGRPQALLKFVSCNYITPAFKQQFQDVERLVLKLDSDAVFA